MTDVELGRLVARDGVLLDTNLLLLYVAAGFDPKLVGRGRLGAFQPADVVTLKALVRPAARRVTTPHVLAETGNLLDQLVPRRRHAEARAAFARVVRTLAEVTPAARRVVDDPEFARVGLTDAALGHLGDPPPVVLTIDLPLVTRLSVAGLPCVNLLLRLHAAARRGR